MKHPTTPFAMMLLFSLPAALHAEEPSLEKLRKDFAERYFEPDSHIALARYFHDKGRRLQAFRLLESARRGLFSQEQFDAAFDRGFLRREPFDNSKDAEAALLEQQRKNAKSPQLAVKLADIYISRADWSKARQFLDSAIKLKPDDFTNVAALAEVYNREGRETEANQVVKTYLNQHPESKEALTRRIEPLMTTDRAAAKKLLEEGLKKFPQEGTFAFNMGVVLQDENKLQEAEEQFVRAVALAKDSSYIQGWTGRFFLKVKNDESKALEYYLNAYFLDPHFYDSEHAEHRIWTISREMGQKRYEGLKKGDTKLEVILGDENPLVVGLAIDEMEKRWDARYIQPLLKALGHDDDYVRAKALRQLIANAGQSFENDLKALLQDGDLRKRGMAGYLAVKLWGARGIAAVKPWLNEEAQLLRFDAVSSLFQYGGEDGRKIALDHIKHEKHPLFKEWLEAATKER
jgi:Tfp pilus assembly protein PilF